jgi:mutator protein MutT
MQPSDQPASAVMHVMAGVLLDADGRVLLAQRPPGKHLAGSWEFPGGKREPGESPLDALARELHEELGIDVLHAEPLIRVPWHYGERELLLDAWRIDRWKGLPQSLEGQALEWAQAGQVDPAILVPADRPILQALLSVVRQEPGVAFDAG